MRHRSDGLARCVLLRTRTIELSAAGTLIAHHTRQRSVLLRHCAPRHACSSNLTVGSNHAATLRWLGHLFQQRTEQLSARRELARIVRVLVGKAVRRMPHVRGVRGLLNNGHTYTASKNDRVPRRELGG